MFSWGVREARRREGRRGRLPEKRGCQQGLNLRESWAQDFKDFEKVEHACPPLMGRGLKKECDHNMQDRGP